MRIAFCIYDFTEHNLPLQPWLTIRHVAETLSRNGHTVHLLSDTKNPAAISGVDVHSVDSLRGSNSRAITNLLHSIRPDALVFLPTPLNSVTTPWLDAITCRRIGFASYSFYNARELYTAARCLGLADTKQYLRHLFIPRPVWIRMLSTRCDSMIAQSASTTQRLHSAIGHKTECHHIPPGITLDDWPYVDNAKGQDIDNLQLLYMGAATPIRGFNIVLQAMAKIRATNIKLRILARGADSDAMVTISDMVANHNLENRVEIEGGWIDRATLKEEIYNTDAVLQPFVIVPSEFPVTALEVIACGTPVIGSNINGLPSTIGPAGTVVQHGSASALAAAITRFAQSAQIRTEWQNGCHKQRLEMIDWETVANRWENVLRG